MCLSVPSGVSARPPGAAYAGSCLPAYQLSQEGPRRLLQGPDSQKPLTSALREATAFSSSFLWQKENSVKEPDKPEEKHSHPERDGIEDSGEQRSPGESTLERPNSLCSSLSVSLHQTRAEGGQRDRTSH